jgi:hypothetical protein
MPEGTLKSEPGFDAIDAELLSGADNIHMDPDGKHLRLDVRSQWK